MEARILAHINMITNLECAWDKDNPSLQGLWKHIRASMILYDPVHQFKNSDMAEYKKTWFHLCRILK